MFRLTRTRILSISICIFRLSARAGAYAIDESCKPYSGDGQDKTALITAAMTEANLMQQAAAGAVVAPASAQDDTLTKLFPGASATDLTDIASMSPSRSFPHPSKKPQYFSWHSINIEMM